ncbi:hypothetical protein PoB_007316500 [Plakobranchus ocellatus]|uniref:Uncharacterized protein n=1 Tax=Plakobranchus ocellatus TaxID=259542 RepID=A0AAV4DR82_9GAST|nr:hypothetical protein PoB_007316500 [Plakobranchus ocellatus]
MQESKTNHMSQSHDPEKWSSLGYSCVQVTPKYSISQFHPEALGNSQGLGLRHSYAMRNTIMLVLLKMPLSVGHENPLYLSHEKCHICYKKCHLVCKHTFLNLRVSVNAVQEQWLLAIFYRAAGSMRIFNCRYGQNHQCWRQSFVAAFGTCDAQ